MVQRLPWLFFVLLLCPCASQGQGFKCTSTPSCPTLVSYVVTTEGTTYEDVRRLFWLWSIYSLYGANGLKPTIPDFTKIPVNTILRVPLSCSCIRGVGVVDGPPLYNFRDGDDLATIARETFQGLVTYQQIAAANGIANTSLVKAGQLLKIPLPCSCDPVDGMDVVHLAHVAQQGSTVVGIAREFGAPEATLLRVNNISDPSGLVAGQVLDVPLRACSSSIRRNASDYPLRVPDGSYAVTYNNCVKCSCSAESGWRLRCVPVDERDGDLYPKSSMGCQGLSCLLPLTDSSFFSFGVGTRTPFGSGTSCRVFSCEYAGYDYKIDSAMAVANQSTSCVNDADPDPFPPSTEEKDASDSSDGVATSRLRSSLSRLPLLQLCMDLSLFFLPMLALDKF